MPVATAAGTPATYTVTTTFDSTDANPGNGVCADALGRCSLRAAIMEANAHLGDDTVILPASAQPYLISLAGNDDVGAQGDLDILENLTIIGSGGNADGAASATVIDGGGIDRVFSANPYPWDKIVNATFKALTIQNGNPIGTGDYGTGGGIDYTGDNGTSTPTQGGQLYIYNCVVQNNQVDGTATAGGGVFLINTNNWAGTASATIEKSVISGNTAADWDGGGIFNSGMSLTIIDSTISNNHAKTTTTGSYRQGGGIFMNNTGTTTIRRSTISGNTAEGDYGIGGGIASVGVTLTVENSTISGNEAGKQGGGIYGGTVTLTNVTITKNYAGTDASASSKGGGGFYISGAKLRNTIVYGNFIGKPSDVSPTANDVGGSSNVDTANSFNNIVGTGAGGLVHGVQGNQVGVNPLIEALADNGGLTKTHKLQSGSPAIEAGNGAFATAYDQRGFARVADSADSNATATVDIGAYEAHPTISNISDQTAAATVPLAVPFFMGDAAQSPAISATSSNQSVVPNGNLVVTNGNTYNPTLTITGSSVGTATITVTVSAGGDSMSDTFVMTVTTPPKASVPSVTGATTNEDTQSASGLVLTPNAADTTVTHFKITGITNGRLFKSNGTTEILNGSFITKAEGASGLRFTPSANFNGTGSFTAQAAFDASGTGLSDSVPASITVVAVNDAPVGGTDTLSAVLEDSAQISVPFATLLANDSPGPSDESTQTLSITGVTAGTGGTVSISGTDVLFTPAANFSGTASFTYTLQDSGLAPNTATVTVNVPVTPIADTPSATNTTAAEDTQSTTGLVLSRNAVDGAEVTHFLITGITGGRLYLSDGLTEITNGAYITYAQGHAGLKFTPSQDLNGPGTGSFTVKAATDGSGAGLSGGATVTIDVTEVNDAPTGLPDTLSARAEDSGPWTIPFAALTGNDSPGPVGESGQTLTVSSVSAPTGGTVALNPVNGNVIFTPAADFTGTAMFTYEVQDNGTTNGSPAPKTGAASASFTVTEVNDAPVGADDTLSSIDEDSGARAIPFADLLVNDSPGPLNESSQTLSVTGINNATGGTAVVDGINNKVIFTPAANFHGTAGFTYTVQDNGTTNGVSDPLTGTASVTFTVNGVAEAPSVTPATTPEDIQSTSGLVVTPDATDGASVTHYKILGILGGSLYKHDGTTKINNGDFITAAEGAAGLKFTPMPDLNTPTGGTFEFTVQAALDSAGTGMSPSTVVTVDVTEVNDAPAGTDDAAGDIAEDSGARTLSASTLLANDSKGPANESSQALSIIAADNPVGGTVEVVDGDAVFTPAANYAGSASFRYTVRDNGTTNGSADWKTSTATVSFMITPMPDAPQTTAASTAEETQSTTGLVLTPSALDGAEVTHLKITAITNGQLYLSDGTTPISDGGFITKAQGSAGLKFTPAADKNSPAGDLFGFTVQAALDETGTGLSLGTPATISVTEVNDAPVGVADALDPVAEDSGTLIIPFAALIGNDTDGADNESGQTLTITAVTAVTGGTVTIDSAANTVSFTPAADYYGVAEFAYTLEDNGTTSGVAEPKTGTGNVTVLVQAVADVPSVTPTTTAEDTQSTTGLVITRNAVDGTEISFFQISGITGGRLYQDDGITEIQNGDFMIAPLGSFQVKFTPGTDLNSPGSSFSFIVKGATTLSGDGLGVGTTATITVTEVNDEPNGVNDTLPNAAEDSGPWTIPFSALTGNDDAGPADEDGQTLTVAAVGNPTGGTVTRSGTDVIFTPTPDFNGTASFTYTVQDNGTTLGGADPKSDATPATVTFTVTPVNDAPVGGDDVLSSMEEDSAPRTIAMADLLANDTNGGGSDESTQTLTITGVTSLAGGTAEIIGSNITFTPAPDFHGTARFTYTVKDDAADWLTDTVEVTFTVTPAAEVPLVTNATTAEGTLSAPDLRINRNAADGAEVTHFKVTAIVGGRLFKSDGTTEIHDGDSITADEGGTGLRFLPGVYLNSLAGDTFSFIVQGALDAAGTGISGGTQATITVTEVNDAPIGADDTPAAVAEDSTGNIILAATLLANDVTGGGPDENVQTLSITAIDQVQHGVATLNIAGDVVFTPEANYYGPASFRYTVSDNGTTNGVTAAQSGTAIATFQVTPVADAPHVTPTSTAEETQSTSGLVITRNTVDAAEVTHFQITGITGGQLYRNDGLTKIQDGDFITAGEGAAGLKFTPDTDLNTLAGNTFTFTVKAALDGAGAGLSVGTPAAVTVTEVNDDPTGVADTLANVAEDSGDHVIAFSDLTVNDVTGPNENGQSLSVVNVTGAVGITVGLDTTLATITFTPVADFTGTASFTYTLQDNGTTAGTSEPKTSTAVVTFTVTEVNDQPIGADDTLADVAEDSGPWTIPFTSLLGNDSAGPANEDTQTLTVSAVSSPTGGTVEIQGTNVIFTPTLNFNGTASFTYTLEDDGTTDGVADPRTSTAEGSFTVTPTPDVPVAQNKALSVMVGQTATGSLTALDVDGDTLTYALVDAPTKGTVTITAAGVFTYKASSTGTDTFTFKVNDGTADSNVATVTVSIYSVPPPPPQPYLTITVPVTETRESSIDVSGTANPYYTVVVNGTSLTADGAGNWHLTVSLAEGPNVITATNGSLSKSVTVVRDTIPPELELTAPTIRTDADSITLTALSEEGALIRIEGQEGATLTVPLKMGSNKFTATATDRVGNQSTASITVLRVPTVAVEVPKGQGGEASVQYFRVQLPGAAAPEPLLLQVTSPSIDSAAVRAAETAALVAGTGDAHATGLNDGTPVHTFPAAATVKFTYDPARVADPADLKIFYYDTKWKVWVELGGSVDPTNHTITVQVEHFTTFAALEPQSGAPVLDAIPAVVRAEQLSVTGTGTPGSPVTLVINGASQTTVQTDAAGRFTMAGTLAEGRNWVYVKGTGVLASREMTVIYQTGNYTDIDGYWAEPAIRRLAKLGILSLYPEPLFQPTERVTRLEFAVMVSRVLALPATGEGPTFTDTDQMPLWARAEVAAAVKAGIIKGMPDGSFAPNAFVTRAEMAVMLTRALQYAGKDLTPGGKLFTDEAKIPSWAKAQVLTAARYGLITGYPDGTFGAGNSTTRGEAVTMLNRLLDALTQ